MVAVAQAAAAVAANQCAGGPRVLRGLKRWDEGRWGNPKNKSPHIRDSLILPTFIPPFEASKVCKGFRAFWGIRLEFRDLGSGFRA